MDSGILGAYPFGGGFIERQYGRLQSSASGQIPRGFNGNSRGGRRRRQRSDGRKEQRHEIGGRKAHERGICGERRERAGGFGLYDYSYGNARERHGPDGFMDSGMDEWGKRLGERKGGDGVSELNAVCKYAHRDACV